MSLIKNIGIGLVSDTRQYRTDLLRSVSALDQIAASAARARAAVAGLDAGRVGTIATPAVSGSTAAGESGLKDLGAEFDALGARIHASLQSAFAPLGSVAASVSRQFNRVGGTVVETSRRVASAIKFIGGESLDHLYDARKIMADPETFRIKVNSASLRDAIDLTRTVTTEARSFGGTMDRAAKAEKGLDGKEVEGLSRDVRRLGEELRATTSWFGGMSRSVMEMNREVDSLATSATRATQALAGLAAAHVPTEGAGPDLKIFAPAPAKRPRTAAADYSQTRKGDKDRAAAHIAAAMADPSFDAAAIASAGRVAEAVHKIGTEAQVSDRSLAAVNRTLARGKALLDPEDVHFGPEPPGWVKTLAGLTGAESRPRTLDKKFTRFLSDKDVVAPLGKPPKLDGASREVGLLGRQMQRLAPATNAVSGSFRGLAGSTASATTTFKGFAAQLGVVIGVGAGLRAVVSSAMAMETAMAGLAKATDLDAAGMANLRREIFGLSTEMKGVRLDDLMAIATTGAKLGIAAGDLKEYARGIAMISTAMDDVPAPVIADQVGKVNSVFKLGIEGAQQLGSAIDRLADNGVSASKDILEVTQRISGTAAAMKLGAPEATALAAALLDTGTHAELGASAISRLLQFMVRADNHADFAKVMGISAGEFATTIKDKPIVAVQGFLAALRKLDAAGQLAALKGVGFKGAQGAGEIQKLAQQSDSLARYVGMASEEFRTLNQLNKSYAATAQTTEATLDQVKNKFQVLAVTIGDSLLPALNAGLTRIGPMIEGVGRAFQDTFLVGLAEISTRVAEFPQHLESAFGEQGRAILDGFTSAVDGIGFAWRNLPDLFDVAAMMVTQKVLNLSEHFAVLPANLGTIGEWIGNEWVHMIEDALSAAGAAVGNFATNIGGLFTALKGLANGEGFNFQWKGLLDGFEATTAQLPALMSARLTDLSPAIDDKLKAIADKEAARARAATGKAAAGALGKPAKAIPGTGGEFEGDEDGKKKKKKEPKEAAALELGSREAASAVAKFRNAGASQKPVEETARNTTDLVKLQRETLAYLKRAKDSGNAVKLAIAHL